jgi:hypothetical protein
MGRFVVGGHRSRPPSSGRTLRVSCSARQSNHGRDHRCCRPPGPVGGLRGAIAVRVRSTEIARPVVGVVEVERLARLERQLAPSGRSVDERASDK